MEPATDKLAEPPRSTRVAAAVAAFQAGDDRDGSFTVLVEIYLPAIRRFFARRVAAPQDRQDLTQEVFLRVYKGLKGFRGDSSFATWLFRIARNTHGQWRRRRFARPEAALEVLKSPAEQREDKAGEPEIPDPGQPLPEAVALDDERRRLLRKAIAELPPQMRQAMVLRIVHGLKYREIAAVMRISIDTVKAHLFQARTRVREDLQGRFENLDF